jgi:uncharacterized protein with von Willebrand factor type A (vWA) domain
MDVRRPQFMRNLTLFGRLLRAGGLRVTPERISRLAEGLLMVDLERREDVYNTCRCLLMQSRSEQAAFDQAFGFFWRIWEEESDVDGEESHIRDFRSHAREGASVGGYELPGSAGRSAATGSISAESSEDGSRGRAQTWSHIERLRGKDFAAYTQEELLEARRAIGKMRWQMARRRSRRLKPSARGKRLDIQKMLRLSLSHGGEMFQLAGKRPKLKRRPIVVLCDISGSMSAYTRVLLHFLHSLEQGAGTVESFVFGTRLTRLTPQLKQRAIEKALVAASTEVRDWLGGTRIGEALRTFNRVWARRMLDRGAIVLLISDGWDRGDPELLSQETARLQRSSFRLIWLNPLAGSPSYEPLTRGLLAALPYVDDVLSVRNLASLEVIAARLGELRDVRPDRRSSIRSREPGGL